LVILPDAFLHRLGTFPSFSRSYVAIVGCGVRGFWVDDAVWVNHPLGSLGALGDSRFVSDSLRFSDATEVGAWVRWNLVPSG